MTPAERKKTWERRTRLFCCPRCHSGFFCTAEDVRKHNSGYHTLDIECACDEGGVFTTRDIKIPGYKPRRTSRVKKLPCNQCGRNGKGHTAKCPRHPKNAAKGDAT